MTRLRIVAAAALGLLAAPSQAAFLITNGGFESNLTGWTVVDQAQGSGSWYSQTGTASPLNGFAVPAPPQGTRAAMTDQFGPGSHVLYQDFVVPVGVTSATLSFQRFIQNFGGLFANGSNLDYNTFPNQQARVDIVLATANPFSVAAGDVLQNVFQTNPGDPLTSGYTTVTANLTPLLASRGGQTLRLRFAEVDNQGNFNFGVDTVSLEAVTASPVPAPPAAALALMGLLSAGGLARFRRRVAA